MANLETGGRSGRPDEAQPATSPTPLHRASTGECRNGWPSPAHLRAPTLALVTTLARDKRVMLPTHTCWTAQCAACPPG